MIINFIKRKRYYFVKLYYFALNIHTTVCLNYFLSLCILIIGDEMVMNVKTKKIKADYLSPLFVVQRSNCNHVLSLVQQNNAAEEPVFRPDCSF